ncbi:hypothetical protein Tco_0407652 [Tanacetum coccineum]
MSTSKTYQQSLADAGSENRPPMLERGSYIPWASRFRRYLNRKRDNRKWLLKALDEGPYEFKNFVPEGSTIPRLQTAEDLEDKDERNALVFVNRARAMTRPRIKVVYGGEMEIPPAEVRCWVKMYLHSCGAREGETIGRG